tara:strand:+ start:1948 stop:2853 length:906 start_codon:yes stop_codon:yes gene_type:complete
MLKSRVYIKKYDSHAGKWIYEGYRGAWENLGFKTHTYTNLSEIKDENYYLMAIDAEINLSNFEVIKKSKKSFIYAQPNSFPSPWGSHPNFSCQCPDNMINKINKQFNTILWSFLDYRPELFNKWKIVHTIPLAFDEFTYRTTVSNKDSYDVCFIGGWADNGFNEKKKIMIDYFKEFKKTNLKCGFYVNRNIPQDSENRILFNSKIAINLHDAYQRITGLDTNERTYKSLGLNGFLVSDKVAILEDFDIKIPMYNKPEEMISFINEIIKNPDLKDIKEKNKKIILDSHCYRHRVNKLLGLKE